MAQPEASRGPFPRNGCRRDTQRFGGIFDGKAGKITQLDYAALTLVQLGQPSQGIIENKQVQIPLLPNAQVLVESDWRNACSPLDRSTIARVIYQDFAHEASGHAEKMGAVLPVLRSISRQPNVGLMNQSRTLQSVIRTFPPQVAARQLAKFRIDQRDK